MGDSKIAEIPIFPMNSPRLFRHDLMELAAAYDQYSVLVTTADLDQPGPQIIYVNSSFTRMTGYSLHDLLGQTPRIMQGPKTNRETLRRLRRALAAGEDFIAREINYKRDGSEFEIEWIINHLRDTTGRTTHYVAQQRDITGLDRASHGLEQFDAELRAAGESMLSALKKLEAAEQQMLQQERLAALGRMAEGVVHDLHNALSPIISFAEFLESVENLSPVAQESVEGIVASAEHGLKLLDNLRMFCGDRASGPPAEAVDLYEIVKRIPLVVRPRLDQHARHGPVQIKLDIVPVPKVPGHVVELAQMLVNLTNNAIDAMTGGGVVTIHLSSHGSTVLLTVSDTGPGIPPEIIDRCFEPYVTTKPEGSGLGLSVCLGIVKRHQGHISVENVGPTGSAVFTIRLPAVGTGESISARARWSAGTPA